MSDVLPAYQLAREIADALESAGLPYAIGGAIAYAAAGAPRATNDVDVNVFIDGENIDALLDLLASLDAEMDREICLRHARERGDFKVYISGTRVDVFLLAIPLSSSAATRTICRDLLGRPVRLLSLEDIVLFKFIYFRPKDQWDLERVIAVRGSDIDRDYVQSWLVKMFGEQDTRVEYWNECLARADEAFSDI